MKEFILFWLIFFEFGVLCIINILPFILVFVLFVFRFFCIRIFKILFFILLFLNNFLHYFLFYFRCHYSFILNNIILLAFFIILILFRNYLFIFIDLFRDNLRFYLNNIILLAFLLIIIWFYNGLFNFFNLFRANFDSSIIFDWLLYNLRLLFRTLTFYDLDQLLNLFPLLLTSLTNRQIFLEPSIKFIMNFIGKRIIWLFKQNQEII